jgi:KDO2-lipid IV(A) lauroyltransferase
VVVSFTHWLKYGFATVLLFAMKAPPRRLALAAGGAIGGLGWSLRLRRKLVLSNVAQAMPAASEAAVRSIAARAARNFGRSIVDIVRFSGRDRDRTLDLVRTRDIEPLQAALEEGRGAIIVTGHLGAWGLYVASVSRMGIPIALLLRRRRNPEIDRIIRELPGKHVTMIPHGPLAPRALLRALKEGKVVVMVADQHGGPRGIVAPFFGRETSTLSLPAALVARRDVPLFAMTGHRLPDLCHELSFRRIEVPAGDGQTEDARRRQIATLCNQSISDAVLQYPEQYFWYHRRFRRDGDPSEPAHVADARPAPES